MQRLLLAGLVSAVLCGAVYADDDPLNDQTVQKTLRAMSDASTWYHPDLFGEFAGMRRYADRHYEAALKYFEVGAYYADKLSQLSIGLMYLNGEGVAKDPVMAYAWMCLAAERDYPDFVATRERIKATLTSAQLSQAETLGKLLAEKYADAVAKPRMEQQLRRGQMQMTGSRTGFDFGIYHMAARQNCGPPAIVGGVEIPSAGCGGADIYAKSRWQPDKYFAARDAQYKATVTVGGIQQVGASPVPDASNADKH